MNREIKFRAWDKKRKEMLELRGFTQNTNTCWYTLYTVPTGFITARIPMEAVLMQYTGLKDKNGKEIYEGDIVEWWPHIPLGGKDKPAKQGVIIWDDTGFNVDSFYETSQDSPNYAFSEAMEFEIISNIHENPELLESGK